MLVSRGNDFIVIIEGVTSRFDAARGSRLHKSRILILNLNAGVDCQILLIN